MIARESTKELPTGTGIYIFKKNDGTVLYVGKANNIRARVRQYFQDKGAKSHFLIQSADRIETVLTVNETEALFLESNLIKKHQPRYNVRLKDDKHYPYVVATVKDEFPSARIVRRVKKDGNRYYGPFVPANVIRDVLRLLMANKGIRDCREAKFRNRSRPCLNYQMDRCSGPCCKKISRKKYLENYQDVLTFLEGGVDEVVDIVRSEMDVLSKECKYERAAQRRDLLARIEELTEQQMAILPGKSIDLDVCDYFYNRENRDLIFQVLMVRGGRMIGKKNFYIRDVWIGDESELEDVAGTLMEQYYWKESPPPVIVTVFDLPMSDSFSGFLKEHHSLKQGETVRIFSGKSGKGLNRVLSSRGAFEKLVEVGRRNILNSYEEERKKAESGVEALELLQKKLKLKKLPSVIEAVDISNIQGDHAVGAIVCFKNGKPWKDRYRKYKIKYVEGQDDFSMIFEVMVRRFRKETRRKDGVPDLILVDGGLGQLNAAMAGLREREIAGEMDIVGIAKSRVLKGEQPDGKAKSPERLFLPGRKNPVILDQSSPAILLLQRIRDEVHRFVITYHRKLRDNVQNS